MTNRSHRWSCSGSAVLLLLGGLAGCSMLPDIPDVKVPGMDKLTGENGMFRDRKGDYLKAATIPRTSIPASLDSFVIDDLLVIPDLPPATPEQAFLDPPRPRPIEGRSDREVVIQRMDNRSWIIVDVSPSQVWPRIRDYWRENNVVITAENPTTGVMETGWFTLDGNVVTQEKFRVTVDTGFQDNSAEIRLLHMDAPQATPVIVQRPFPASSMNAETEFTVLSSLSSYLADVANLYQASSVSLLAGNIDSTGKASLVQTPAGSQVLRLEADYNRCWAALGRALQRAGVQVVAQDINQGAFDLVYVPGQVGAGSEEEPGFFRNLVTLYGLLGRDANEGGHALHLQLLRTGDAVEVLATPDPQDPEGQDVGNSLLEMLRNTIA
jgi:outer membrane protein assembly factor BamC